MPSILLVEDETAIADTVLYALRAEGFEARHCLTGQEALRAAGERVHDLAILDVGLPDIGGFALCRELRRERDLPRSEEHTSELQSLMRISYAVFCLTKKNTYSYITQKYTKSTHSL